MGDIGNTFTGLTGKTKKDFGHGDAKFVTYLNVFQNEIATLEQLDSVEIDEQQNKVKKGDVFFTTSSETPEEVGMSSVWTYDIKNIYLNSFTFGYRPIMKLDLKYLASMLRSPSIRKEIIFLAQGISRYNISKTKMMEIKVPVPNISEQKKIGAFFKQLDNTIVQNEQKVDLLKQLKQAYLQKIFSQELRFAGFNALWKKRKIVDLFEERSERSPHGQMISVTMGSGVVLASSLDRKDNSSFDKSNYKVVRKNDIAYNSMRMWQGASGVSPYNGIVSPAYTIITPKANVDSGFFAIQFKMTKSLKTFQKYSQGLTSDTWNLKYPALSSIPMITPDFTEQKKINHFFGIFDDLIDKYEKKVLLLKQKKRSYLQKMFV